MLWARETTDKTDRNLLKHAEIKVYELAQPHIGDDLSRCTLVTTAAPCTSCTPHYAEGKIGKILYAAPRAYVFALTGIMRARDSNLHELLVDGHTDTTVVGNFQATESLGLFATYGKLRQHVPPSNLGSYLRGIWRGNTTIPAETNAAL